MCRPKLVVNICINWLPIFVNFSVILGSQYSLNLFLLFNKCKRKLGKKERINLIVVVVDSEPESGNGNVNIVYFVNQARGNNRISRMEFVYNE